MAILICGKTQCPICSAVISSGQPTVATQHFIQTQSNPLWRYSDAAMHYDCFQMWEHREVFIAEYNKTMGQVVWGNGTRHEMQADGTVISLQATAEHGA